ncbi:hypothetical protein Bra5_PA00101 (plasmid) [Rhizobium phaseoli Brasil 5]|nr:hypothetical protein Bra5_PA00101 [Rhizobium phaseoli Brasil 5]
MGLIAMSERDLQRIEVLSKVIAGRMTMVTAAHVLALSERQVRRLLDRISTDDRRKRQDRSPAHAPFTTASTRYAVIIIGNE